jgi:hypothetical protein
MAIMTFPPALELDPNFAVDEPAKVQDGFLLFAGVFFL